MKILVLDAKRRVRLSVFKPHQALACEFDGDRAVTLTRVEKVKSRKGKLIRRRGRLLLQAPEPLTDEDVKKALEDFP